MDRYEQMAKEVAMLTDFDGMNFLQALAVVTDKNCLDAGDKQVVEDVCHEAEQGQADYEQV